MTMTLGDGTMMQYRLIDRKSPLSYTILNGINEVAVANHFYEVIIKGAAVPSKGAFILIANHSSRWDGPVVQHVIGRPTNYMVSPNELKGLQGLLLRSFGAFPANPRFDLLPFMRTQVGKNEGIVIFPEGNVFKDGMTHPFKKGAARIALACAAAGLNVPVVPVGIKYLKSEPDIARVLVGEPIDISAHLDSYLEKPNTAIASLTESLYREICHLRVRLGSAREREVVFGMEKPARQWVLRNDMTPAA